MSTKQLCLGLAVFSTLLSVLAFVTDPVLNRDGMHYIHLARLVADGQVAEALSRESWPFLLLLLGKVSQWTGLDPLSLGIVFSGLCGLLMQCALFLLLLRYDSRHVWLALLVASCFPVLVHYRGYIIRDAGAWAALLVGMWAMVSWWQSRRSGWLVLFLVSALAAFLFRIEMAVMVAAAGAVWLRALYQRGSFGRWPATVVVPAMGLTGAVLVAGLFLAVGKERLGNYWNMAGGSLFHHFREAVAQMEPIFWKYIADDLPVLLAAGLMAVLLVTLAKLSGVFVLPLLAGLRARVVVATARADGGLSVLLALLFLAVVGGFTLVNLFLVSRYAVPTLVAMLPLVYLGLVGLYQRVPSRAWRGLFLFLALVGVLDQAISTGPGKRYIIDGGHWVAEHKAELGELFIADQRVSFYAGLGYHSELVYVQPDEYPPGINTLVLTYRASVDTEQQHIDSLRESTGLQTVLYRSGNDDGDGVVVLGR